MTDNTTLAALDADTPWRDAVTDACVVVHIGWDEANPRKTLDNLIAWHNAIALDPRVSVDAQKLLKPYLGAIHKALLLGMGADTVERREDLVLAHIVATRNVNDDLVALTLQDNEHRIIATLWERED